MPVQPGQFVNIHAHREAAAGHEWVLTSMMVNEHSPGLALDANFSVGIHPWQLSETDIDSALQTLQNTIKDPHVLALGEAGLDKLIDIPLATQLSVFEAQAEIAEANSMPIIIHMVRTAEEFIRYIKTHRPGVPNIIHGFRGNREMAKDLVRAGFYLSFGEALVTTKKVREAFTMLPLERLFLETDESTMDIRRIYEFAASCRSLPENVLMKHMAEKTNTLFLR